MCFLPSCGLFLSFSLMSARPAARLWGTSRVADDLVDSEPAAILPCSGPSGECGRLPKKIRSSSSRFGTVVPASGQCSCSAVWRAVLTKGCRRAELVRKSSHLADSLS